MPDWGLSGATTTTSPISFITEIKFLSPGALIPSSFVTNINGLFIKTIVKIHIEAIKIVIKL